MPSKADILRQLESLVLITEEQRAILRQIIEDSDEEGLMALEQLFSREKAVIEGFVEGFIESGVAAGDVEMLQHLDEILQDTAEDRKQLNKLQENEESSDEDQQAEDLLKQMP